MSTEKIIEYYNQLASDYDENRFGNSYGQFIDFQERKILNKIFKTKSNNVLDLACGSGRLSNYATSGADASEEMLKIAKKKFPKNEFFLAQSNQLPFENESFERCFTFHFIMHLNKENFEKTINEVHRILSKNGTFVFDIPVKNRRKILNQNKADWHAALSFDQKEIEKLINNKFEIKRKFSILFIPIHRIPTQFRKFFLTFDFLLSNFGLLKNFSSYHIYELKKL
ncbi:class I SAM-dependent methyltransferase [Cloacibacterium sp.]|uniref:class I SAM-dependent methyltransferase n=1 Tax=Cloacibacterium sp. TaxID=1913682 RepID=UPI0035B4C64F